MRVIRIYLSEGFVIIMKYTITTRYGDIDSWHTKPHSGIDFAMELNEPLRSIANGTCKAVDYGNTNIGKGVLVNWDDGKTTAIYGHMNKVSCKTGEHISEGDIIGYAGSTGRSSGNHLHFGLKQDGHFIDPSPYIENIQSMNDTIQRVQAKTYHLNDLLHQQSNIFKAAMENMPLNLSDYSCFIHDFQHLYQFFS